MFLTETEIAEIFERWLNTTPGVWEAVGMDSGHSEYETDWVVVTKLAGDTICTMSSHERVKNNEMAAARTEGGADAWFISHARSDIINLLTQVSDLQYENLDLKNQLIRQENQRDKSQEDQH